MFKKLNLYSKTETRILEYLATAKTELYEREIAKKTKTSPASVNRILKKFENAEVVIRTQKGRMLFYRRNDKHPTLRYFKIFTNVNSLMPVLEKIVGLCKRVIMFGSCADGRNNEESDVDLLILTNNKNEVKRILDGFPKIQGILLEPGEYAELEKKDTPLYRRIGQGIELIGEENG